MRAFALRKEGQVETFDSVDALGEGLATEYVTTWVDLEAPSEEDLNTIA